MRRYMVAVLRERPAAAPNGPDGAAADAAQRRDDTGRPRRSDARDSPAAPQRPWSGWARATHSSSESAAITMRAFIR